MTNKKRKKKPSSVEQVLSLAKNLIGFFAAHTRHAFQAQALAERLKLNQPLELVEAALAYLQQVQFLLPANDGAYRWNREAARQVEFFIQKGRIPEAEELLEEKTEPVRKAQVPQAESSEEDRGRNKGIGTLDLTRSGVGYVSVQGLNSDVFISQGRLGTAFNGDQVSIRYWKSNRGKYEGEVIGVTKRQTEDFIGTLVIARQAVFVIPDDPKVPVDILVDKTQLKGALNGEKVLVRIRRWHSRGGQSSPVGELILVLGKAGTSDIEMQSILLQNGFNLLFPPDVLAENEAIPEAIPAQEYKKRLDLREVLTFTIDPETAKDFDDALSFEYLENGHFSIGVHIADVSYYVQPNSALDKEAAKRTTSVYLVDRVLPMLPEKLSNGVCSLRPNEDKLTFSAIFEFSPDGKILKEWFGKTVIHSNYRFTYEQAQEQLETEQGPCAQELKILNGFAHQLRQERFKKGAINFETPEVRFALDKDGTPLNVYLKSRKDAHMLIEDFMLLANRRTAALIAQAPQKTGRGITPFVYRVHDMPDMDKVANFVQFAQALGYKLQVHSPQQVGKAFSKMLKQAEGKPESAILQQLAIRTMAKACYTTENIGHYGLSFEHYTHFTSPIRRYADVLSHRILLEFLEKRNLSIKQETLEELCEHISRKERKAMEAERESIKYKQAEYLQTKIGQVFQAVISGIAEHGVYAEIKSNFCEGMIRYDNMYQSFQMLNGFQIASQNRHYRIGDTIWIRVLNAEPQRRQIDMELLDEQSLEVQNTAKEQGIEVQIPQGLPSFNQPHNRLKELEIPDFRQKGSKTKGKNKGKGKNKPSPQIAKEAANTEQAKPKRGGKKLQTPPPPVAPEPIKEVAVSPEPVQKEASKPKRGGKKAETPPPAPEPIKEVLASPEPVQKEASKPKRGGKKLQTPPVAPEPIKEVAAEAAKPKRKAGRPKKTD